MAQKAHEEHLKSEARRASVAGVAANLEYQSALRVAQLRDPSYHWTYHRARRFARKHGRCVVALAVPGGTRGPSCDALSAPGPRCRAHHGGGGGCRRRHLWGHATCKCALDEALALPENSRVAAVLKARTDKRGGEIAVAAVMRLVFGSARGPGPGTGAATFAIPQLEAR
jgi:hypothetical protein